LKLRGLPFDSTPREIVDFMKGFGIIYDQVVMGLKPDGQQNGEAFISCYSHQQAMDIQAAKNGQTIGKRYIEIMECSQDQWDRAALANGRDDVGPGAGTSYGSKGGGGGKGAHSRNDDDEWAGWFDDLIESVSAGWDGGEKGGRAPPSYGREKGRAKGGERYAPYDSYDDRGSKGKGREKGGKGEDYGKGGYDSGYGSGHDGGGYRSSYSGGKGGGYEARGPAAYGRDRGEAKGGSREFSSYSREPAADWGKGKRSSGNPYETGRKVSRFDVGPGPAAEDPYAE